MVSQSIESYRDTRIQGNVWHITAHAVKDYDTTIVTNL